MFESFQKFMPSEYVEQNEIIRYHFDWDKSGPGSKIQGKRLRPILLALSAQAEGGIEEDIFPAAVAVEFIHNFSLIHDDIEDHDDFRHGREAIWKKWGVEKAINAGDALFSLAFRCLSDLNIDRDKFHQVLSILSQTCARLTGGQNLDLSFQNCIQVDLEDYLLMISGKTGSLFSACGEIGAILGGGNENHIRQFADIGMNLGLAFQIRDDWLGLWGISEKTGKLTGNDLVTGKKTFPILYAMKKDHKIADQIRTGINVEDLDRMLQMISETGAREFTLDYLEKLYRKVRNNLDGIESENASVAIINDLVNQLEI
jgi:geranylgeranyl diphosphate synthase, type I